MKTKHKIYAAAGFGIVILGLITKGFMDMNAWYDDHYLEFKKPVEVAFNRPVSVKEREVEITEVVNVIEEVPELEDLNDIEKYICEKWGVYDCKTALAVAKAESGMREEAYNTYNSNGTLDVGIFQINSVHFDKEGCSLKELVDAKKNVDCAYKIWSEQGWTPWMAFNSGNFKTHLDK